MKEITAQDVRKRYTSGAPGSVLSRYPEEAQAAGEEFDAWLERVIMEVREETRQEAYEDGYTKGHADGCADGAEDGWQNGYENAMFYDM